ncbi:DUF998 domain-containing protein [Micromonospora zamorensis]|uniref:DUF998 domain-containing protein n=1 Tax=Micromonospora zamorensis TaxID=709883 RepID=UPI00081FFB7E|nr:DUF998 domain-containing protein [Micromonospora zamorensis]WSK47073.1 DUF998 domain-containing protein [Micromonospora zamorensis]WTE84271.1 DUF998 domain-containing protein [Micromonospora zamorensis]WTI19043.1 DUF998 domain-containing protein [Micromonospora zamorensis]SCG38467.1 Protein of unknown function [Micromonospora zamorensis]
MAEPGRPGTTTAPRARADVARRVAGSAAAGCALAGAVAVTVAVVAGPGPGLTGYVSEAGIAGSGHATTYRIGILALAAALLLVGAALPPGVWAAPALLATGAVFTAVSGAVTCSAGCPLPPFERATAADLVHGGTSIAATASVVLAMVTLAVSGPAGPVLRRLAGLAAAVALPLCAAVGLAMLVLGRGAVVGVLERLVLAVAVLWGLSTATALALARR